MKDKSFVKIFKHGELVDVIVIEEETVNESENVPQEITPLVEENKKPKRKTKPRKKS